MDRGTIKITTIDQLLNSNKYTKSEDLRLILQSFKLPDKGNKKDLVNTLLYKNKDEFEVDELIDMLFTKEELIDGADVFPIEFLNIKQPHSIYKFQVGLGEALKLPV